MLSRLRGSRRAVLVAGLAAFAFSPVDAADLDTSRKPIEQLVGALVELVSTGEIDDPGGLEQLGEVIDDATDIELIGRLALGRHFRSASPEQMAEFQELFRSLMLRKFTGYLSAYAGQDFGNLDNVLRIQGSQGVGGRDTLVKSLVLPEGRDPLRVDWRLRGRDGEPVIIDVVVEGVSLLIAQRSEFGAVIERGGMEALITSLRRQLARPSA